MLCRLWISLLSCGLVTTSAVRSSSAFYLAVHTTLRPHDTRSSLQFHCLFYYHDATKSATTMTATATNITITTAFSSVRLVDWGFPRSRRQSGYAHTCTHTHTHTHKYTLTNTHTHTHTQTHTHTRIYINSFPNRFGSRCFRELGHICRRLGLGRRICRRLMGASP
jgi:hypothetical protein